MNPGSVMTNWQLDLLYSDMETGSVKGQTLTGWCVQCAYHYMCVCVCVYGIELVGVEVMGL